jgi:hypothetical protein
MSARSGPAPGPSVGLDIDDARHFYFVKSDIDDHEVPIHDAAIWTRNEAARMFDPRWLRPHELEAMHPDRRSDRTNARGICHRVPETRKPIIRRGGRGR